MQGAAHSAFLLPPYGLYQLGSEGSQMPGMTTQSMLIKYAWGTKLTGQALSMSVTDTKLKITSRIKH